MEALAEVTERDQKKIQCPQRCRHVNTYLTQDVLINPENTAHALFKKVTTIRFGEKHFFCEKKLLLR